MLHRMHKQYFIYEGILNFIRVRHFFMHNDFINNVKTLSQSLQWANSIKIPILFTYATYP